MIAITITEIILLFNAVAFGIDVVYHIMRMYYERKKVKLLEKQIGGELT